MPEGFSEKYSTTRKNSAENTHSASPACSPGRRGWMPTLKDTVAVRGMANRGPMERYNAQVKK